MVTGISSTDSPAICYTHDNGVWRRWLFITSRNGYGYDASWNYVEIPSMLQAFCSQP